MTRADALALVALRWAHEAAIVVDPVTVAIHRVERVDDGAGGYLTRESDLPPFTGRLLESGRVLQERASEAGSVTLRAWTLYAPADADVKRTPTTTDSFTLPDGRRFEVVRVRPLTYRGAVYGYQAECVEII